MDATPGESAANMTPPVAPSTSPALRATAPASLAQAAGPSAGSTTAAPAPAPAPAPTRPAVNIPAPSYDDGYDNDPDADYDDDDDCEDGAGAAGYDMGNEHIVRSGYLYKRGEKRKTWKKRWFVLRSSKLAYYKNEKEYQLLRFIDMSEVHTVAAVELKGKDHTFGIVTPSRTFYVNAGSRQEMQAWIDDLNAIKQRSAQTYSTDSAATQQTQLQTSPQPLAALSPSALGQGAISTQANTPALAQDDLTSIQPTAMSSGPSAMSAQGGGSTGLGGGGGGILSSSDEDEHDDDWDEDEIADQAMPLPGPALGLTTSVNTNTQLSTSPSAYSSSSNPDAPQMAQMSPQQQALQQPKPGASLLSNPNKVIMQGYLMKQSKGRKHWRKRWFVLSSSRLLYAKDHMNTKAHRVIPISSILDAIEYEHREKDKDRERERDGLTGLTSESSALLSSSPSNTGGVGGGGAYTSLSAAIPIKQQGDASSNRAARGAVAGLTDSGSETERHKGERESMTRTRQRSRSRDMSDGGLSASGAASGAAPTGPGAGGAAPSTALLSTSATSSSITHGSTSGDATAPAPPSAASGSGPAAGSTTSSQQQQQPQQQPPQQQQQQQQAASSPILIPTSSPRPPLSQLTSMTLSPGGDAAGTSTTESGAVGGVKARTKRKENCFKIITPKRVYLVCAPSEEEEIKWLSALRALLSTRR